MRIPDGRVVLRQSVHTPTRHPRRRLFQRSPADPVGLDLLFLFQQNLSLGPPRRRSRSIPRIPDFRQRLGRRPHTHILPTSSHYLAARGTNDSRRSSRRAFYGQYYLLPSSPPHLGNRLSFDAVCRPERAASTRRLIHASTSDRRRRAVHAGHAAALFNRQHLVARRLHALAPRRSDHYRAGDATGLATLSASD